MSQTIDPGFPVKGSLSKTPFPTIVRKLAEGKSSGSLYLLNGKTKKVVFFEDGTPVFVRSNVLTECLGQRLAAEGLISQEQCDQTLEAIRRTGKKQGELLVEMGILSEGNLRYGLLSQLRFKLFEIFTWPEGKYQFKPGKSGQDFGLRMDYSPEATIAVAILEGYDEARAREGLAEHEGQYPMYAAVDSDDLELLPAERRFYEGLDGSRSVKALLEHQDAQHIPRPATLLLALIESTLVTLLEHAADPQPPPPETPDPARDEPDDAFIPEIEPSDTLTEYEDTPLPGKLPSRSVDMSDEDEAMFAGVEDSQVTTLPEAEAALPGSAFNVDAESSQEVPAELLAAEFGEVEEVFDDDIELVDDDAIVLEDEDDAIAGAPAEVDPDALLDGAEDLMLEDDALDPSLDEPLADLADLDGGDASADPGAVIVEAEEIAAGAGDLMGLDDLDDIDLGDEAPMAVDDVVEAVEPEELEELEELEDDVDPEVEGAMQFAAGETALQEGDWAGAVAQFEAAYESGVDVAELHAHLAYARFNTAPDDEGMCSHALELLEYAEGLNPNLDLIFAYRGAVLQALGDMDGARATLEHALTVNPYCDLAIELMDRL